MRIFNSLIPALLFAAASPLSAAEATHEAAAEALVKQINLEKSTKASFEAMVAPMAAGVTRGVALSPELTAKVEGTIRSWLAEDVFTPDFFKRFTALYTAAFTEQELEELTAFYKTPLGQKTLSTLPGLFEKSSEIGSEAATANQPKLMKRLQPLVPEIEAARIKAKAQ